ncbi:MAG TPA: hypothetical protein PKL17_01810, partial [Pseudomonadota bacterium]|nr:hypothetical protein [Pseudomonadota bacterium]
AGSIFPNHKQANEGIPQTFFLFGQRILRKQATSLRALSSSERPDRRCRRFQTDSPRGSFPIATTCVVLCASFVGV